MDTFTNHGVHGVTRSMKYEYITEHIIEAACKVHTTLGPGLLERPYLVCLRHEIIKKNLVVDAELTLPVHYDGIVIDIGYRLDLLVENVVIIEVKAVQQIAPIHKAQLLSYLKLSGKPVGLLINFHVDSLKHGIHRLVN